MMQPQMGMMGRGGGGNMGGGPYGMQGGPYGGGPHGGGQGGYYGGGGGGGQMGYGDGDYRQMGE